MIALDIFLIHKMSLFSFSFLILFEENDWDYREVYSVFLCAQPHRQFE